LLDLGSILCPNIVRENSFRKQVLQADISEAFLPKRCNIYHINITLELHIIGAIGIKSEPGSDARKDRPGPLPDPRRPSLNWRTKLLGLKRLPTANISLGPTLRCQDRLNRIICVNILIKQFLRLETYNLTSGIK
jgi:hypothetical protein